MGVLGFLFTDARYSMTCDSTFEQGEFGRCECGSGQARDRVTESAGNFWTVAFSTPTKGNGPFTQGGEE